MTRTALRPAPGAGAATAASAGLRPRRRRMLAALPALWAMLAGAPARAQGVAPDTAPGMADTQAWLGLDEAALLARQPGLERVARPERLAAGLRGLWRLPLVVEAGRRYQVTFFLAQQQLLRIEWLLLEEDASGAAYAALVQSYARRLGAGLVAGDAAAESRMQATAWVDGAVDVSVIRSGAGAGPLRVRVVLRHHVEKDGSTL